jgi:hypothetical protein
MGRSHCKPFALKRADNTCPDSAALSLTPLEDWTTLLNVSQTIGSRPQKVEHLAPGRYRVSASVTGGSCYAVPKTVNIGEESGVIEVMVSPAGGIRGTIRGGAKLGGTAPFLAVLTSTDSPLGSARVAHPDAAGAFAFAGLPPGRYRLAAAPANETSQARWMAADPRAVNVNVMGGTTVSQDIEVPAAQQ